MARKLKHKKLRNTGLLYELLIRQVTSDILNNTSPSSISIIKKYFGKDSPLKEELHLYDTLLNQKVKDSTFAIKIVEAVIATKEGIDYDKLNKMKYNLVKEIDEKLDKETFFKTKVEHYPIYASICNLLEYNEKDSPSEFTDNKLKIADHLLSPVENTVIKEELEGVDPELRALTFKLLVERFNAKWSNLNAYQKEILRHYIFNTISNKDTKEFISEKVEFIRGQLNETIKKSPDKILRIKLNETVGLLDKIEKASFITETHYLSLIRYHELLSELKTA